MVAIFLLPILALSAETPVVVTGRPWAPFISPMGEPFRAHKTGDDTLAAWFAKADQNHDGALTAMEMQADADRFFATLDSDGNGEIDPDELTRYEWEIAPEIQVGTRWRNAMGVKPRPTSASDGDADKERRDKRRRRDPDDTGTDGLEYGLQGGGRYALLNIPEPVAAADGDLNRAVSRGEFRQAALDRFQQLDRARKSTLTLADLDALRPPSFKPAKRPKRDKDAADPRVGVPLPPGS